MLPDGYEIQCFRPSLRHPFLSIWNKSGHEENYHNLWVELRWAVVSLMRYRIYYVTDGNVIIHTSYCSPKCFKFPFMKQTDFFIGPCHTEKQHFGQNIYPIVLRYICSELKKNDNNIYGIVNESNLSSRHGILKAGFRVIGPLQKTVVLKRYILEKHGNT